MIIKYIVINAVLIICILGGNRADLKLCARYILLPTFSSQVWVRAIALLNAFLIVFGLTSSQACLIPFNKSPVGADL